MRTRSDHRFLLAILLFVSCISGLSQPAAGQYKIPNGPDAFSDVQYAPIRLDFYRRMLVEPYKQHGERDDKWDEKAIAALDAAARYFADTPDRPLIADANRLIGQARGDGCKYPMLEAITHEFYVKRDNWVFGPDDWARLLPQIPEGKFPHFTRFMFHLWAVDTFKRFDKDEEKEKTFREAIDLAFQCIKAGEAKDHERRILFERLRPDLLEGTRELWLARDAFIAGLEAKDGADHWLASMLRGTLQMKIAWDFRGNGFANTVTPQGWAGFRKHLGLAAQHFRKAHALHPEYPEAATDMIEVSAVGIEHPGENEIIWFNRAMAAQMDWPRAYSRLAWFSLPRWGGSHEQIRALASAALRTGRFDTLAPFQTYFILDKINMDTVGKTAFFREEGVYKIIAAAYEGIAKEPRWAPRRNETQSEFAYFAWRAGQYMKSREILDSIDNQVVEQTIMKQGVRPHYFIGEARARGSKAANAIHAADALVRKREFDRASAAYRAAEAMVVNDSFASTYVRGLMMNLEVLRVASEGKWASLTFDQDMAGWVVREGVFKVKDEKTIVGKGQIDGLRADFVATIGHRFEFEARITMPGNKRYDNMGALLFAMAELPKYECESVVIWPEWNFFAVRENMTRGKAVKQEMDAQQNLLKITVWDSDVAVHINGKHVRTEQWLDADESHGQVQRIGIGGFYKMMSHQAVEFSNLRLRLLSEKPDVFD